MTLSVFCAELPTSVTFDSLGAAINAAYKFTKDLPSCTKSRGRADLRLERRDIEIECLRRKAPARA
jgi:hypothetical protein